MFRINILMVLLFFIGSTGLYAQEERSEIHVGFRVNSSYLDLKYADNAHKLQTITDCLQRVLNDPTLSELRISFCGSASPEGNYQLNKRLARERLTALEQAVRSKVNIPDSIITRIDEYIPWDYLTAMVKDSDLPHREEILMIIGSRSEIVSYRPGQHIDSRILRLQKLDGGRAWRELNSRYFSRMRNACVVFVTYRRQAPATVAPATVRLNEKTASMPVPVLSPVQAAPAEEPFYMAVKTNLLYDALLVPNVGVEFHIGKGFTIGANWMYAWWHNDRKHNYWRVYGGDINIRKYFGSKAEEKPLQGHHIGIYAQALTYDFELGGKGVMGGVPGGNIFDKLNYGVGVEYGYSLPIARKLNLDFTVGVGYLGGEYHEYKPVDGCYVWQATKNRHWFGPTKAEVSLVWLLGKGNVNQEKGGRR